MSTPSLSFFFFLLTPRPPTSTLFPYTTLFRSLAARPHQHRSRAAGGGGGAAASRAAARPAARGDVSSTDRKSTRLNSSHITISYAVFCLKKKKKKKHKEYTEITDSSDDAL